MNNKELALSLFGDSFNCTQSVVTAFAEDYGLSTADTKRLASAFGGGIGGTQNVCGAVSGALMVIGMRYFDEADKLATKAQSYEKAKDFLAAFTEAHGAIHCDELLGCDMQEAKEKDLFSTRCTELIASACDILKTSIL